MENINAKKFAFFLKGTNGKAVLLIHGITGTPSEMRYLGRGLNKAGFTVLCNTLPRHCQTLSELKKVTWQELVEAILSDLIFLKEKYTDVSLAGISMGALVGIHLAHKFPSRVSGIVALAPTLFYDGWALQKGKILMNIGWHIPFLRKSVNIRERWPYGLKDEVLRSNIQRFYRHAKVNEFDHKVFLFGSPFFPLSCLYQHYLFAKIVKKELPLVRTPIIILHAKEDDMTSPRNAEYVYQNISSRKKSLVILRDSYHMLTIDQEKDKVVQEVVNFLNKL